MKYSILVITSMTKHWQWAKEIEQKCTDETMSLGIVFLSCNDIELADVQHAIDVADIVLFTHVGSTLDTPLVKGIHKYITQKQVPYVLLFHDSASDVQRYGVADEDIDQIKAYLHQGGTENFYGLCQYMLSLQGYTGTVEPVKELPYQGILGRQGEVYPSYEAYRKDYNHDGSVVGIFFYRDEWVQGKLDYPYALYDRALEQGLSPVLVFGQYSSKSGGQLRWYDCWHTLFDHQVKETISLIINTCKFSIIGLQGASRDEMTDLGIPILQGFVTYTTLECWQRRSQGLEPMDISFSLSLPEIDGILNGHIVGTRTYSEERGYYFKPYPEGIQKLVDQAKRWIASET